MNTFRRITSLPRIFHVNSELFDPKILAKVPTHQLFTRLGLIHHPKSGLVHWLPIGMLILDKLCNLVHKEMRNIGSEQISLSTLSHASIWKKSGRWAGTELFKLQDSSKSEFCLAPTCEEEITSLIKDQVRSYKQFSLSVYQIKSKFRDEKRPRSGLLRGKEFIMKDAYTFDITRENAIGSYQSMADAYRRIFGHLKVPFVMADADSGEIGGSFSHEWHYIHETGEDTLFTCSSCGESSNVERAFSYPVEEQQCSDISVSYHTTQDQNTLICAYFPLSRDYRPQFLKYKIPDIDLSRKLTEKEIADIFSDINLSIPKKIVRVMDSRLNPRSNVPNLPIEFINRTLITTLTGIPIVAAEEGEICFKCENGKLAAKRAIEVGHTFFLDDKYTKTFDFTTEHPSGNGTLKKSNILMGCYGIGISRLIAAVAEINRDGKGLRWPACIAPWQVTVLNNTKQESIAKELLFMLSEHAVDYRVDDRFNVRMGKKIKDSNMLGIPLILIVGKQYPKIEIEVRGKIQNGDFSETHESELSWEVRYAQNGSPQKYIVDMNEAGRAIQLILSRM